MGNAGNAMILMSALAGLAIVTPFFFLHASHVYVTTLTHSSGGDNKFRWPKDSVYDWFGQGVVVFGVFMVWTFLALMPTALFLLLVPPQWAIAVWLAIMWLAMPISLCSVMMAPSRLLFLYPPLIGRLLRQGKGLLYVYLLTLPPSAVVGVGVFLLVVRQNPIGIIAVSFGLPFALLLHGRAWGRLTWLALNYDRKPRSKKRKRKPKPAPEALDVPLETVDDDENAYVVNTSLTPTGDRLITMTEHYDQQQEYERKIRIREGNPNPDIFDAPEIPNFRTALLTKVIDFVFDSECLGVCFNLGLVGLLDMVLLYLFVTCLIGMNL